VNALIHLSTISKSQFQAHATVCDDFRNANPERYKKIMDYSMHVSIFNERGDTKPKRNPVMSKQDLLQALRTLKHI